MKQIFWVLFIVFGTSTFLSAQTEGWIQVQDNNFPGARAAFENTLKNKPDDESALAGLMFLAETLQDQDLYETSANRLLRQHPESHYVWLFDHMYTGRPEFFLDKNLPFSLTIPFRHDLADSLFLHRRFEESTRIRQSIVPDWQWYVTGPFRNLGGSGFVETTPVETKPFDLADTFYNENGLPLRWVQRRYFTSGDVIDFNEMPAADGLGLYYATTFIESGITQKVALRISRQQPAKIWLDGQLLCQMPDATAGHIWDNESFSFTLPAGMHRILVKVAEFPAEQTGNRLLFNDFYNEGVDYDEEYYEEDEDPNGSNNYDPSSLFFCLRFTDPATGELLGNIQPVAPAGVKDALMPWEGALLQHQYVDYFRKQAEANPEALWLHYLLAKAYLKSIELETGEAFFAEFSAAHPGAAFAKFLLAKFYDVDDKGDRAEALLSEMDTVSAPTIAEHYIRLDKINSEREEAQYIAAMEKMLELSPTHWPILNRYLEFLEEKGRKNDVRNYVRSFLNENKSPKWNDRLAHFLEDDSYKPESYKPLSDRERNAMFRQAQRNLKRHFDIDDYETLLRYYNQKEKQAESLKIFDELLSISSDNYYWKYRKARFLFEKGRTDEALSLLKPLTAEAPYDANLFELIGDIYIEKKEENAALDWYKQAKVISSGKQYGLAEKMEKLEQPVQLSGFFPPIDLESMARDSAWKSMFPDAESVITYFDQQTSYNEPEKQVEISRKMIIRINAESGAKYWTEANLRQLGRITSAKVLKKDGSVTSPNLGWSVAVFKNLQAGDVILLEGIVNHAIPDELPGEFLDLAVISWPIPIVKSSLELLVPQNLPLYFSGNRIEYSGYTQTDTAGYKLLHWEWQNIPKVEEEAAPGAALDAFSWLMTNNTADWSKVVKWYKNITYRRTEINYEVQQEARELIQPGMSQEAIVQVLHTFITRDINYSYVPFMNSNYVPKKPGATLAGKIGDCKDVATLMISLLNEHGIPAWYTLVSTHNFSQQESRPTPYIFNHAIVAYQLNDGLLRYADLTTDYFPTGILPSSDCEAWGLIIRDGETQLRKLPNHLLDPKLSGIDIEAEAVLDADNNLTMTGTMTCRGVVAGNLREIYLSDTPEERLKKMSAYLSGGVLSHVDLEAHQFNNLIELNEPLESVFRLKAFNQMDEVQQFHIIPLPLPISTPTDKLMFATRRYNNLDLEDRFEIAPVSETIHLSLPTGFALVELPADRLIESPFGHYSLQFRRTADGVTVNRNVVFHQRFVPYTAFQDFKQWYLKMLDADETLLVLRKS